MILNTALLYTRNWHVPIILRLLQYFDETFPIAFHGPTLYEKKTENPDIIAVLIPPNTSGQQTSLKPKTLQNQRRFLLTHHPTPVGIVTHARASDFFLCQDNEPYFVYNTIEYNRKVQNIISLCKITIWWGKYVHTMRLWPYLWTRLNKTKR